MHGNGGVLVGVRRLDLGGQRKFVLQRLAAANNCRVKMATVDSATPLRATMWCEKLMVLTSSSGRLGALPKVPAGISEAS